MLYENIINSKNKKVDKSAFYDTSTKKRANTVKYNLTPEQQKKVDELKQMSSQQWETICKRCGICCLCKVQIGPNKQTDNFYTNVCCDAFNPVTRQCTMYENRLKRKKKDCKKVDLDVILDGTLIPRTCGYVEYIFGPAPFKTFVDWQSVRPETLASLKTPLQILQHLILDSKNWNKR